MTASQRPVSSVAAAVSHLEEVIKEAEVDIQKAETIWLRAMQTKLKAELGLAALGIRAVAEKEGAAG